MKTLTSLVVLSLFLLAACEKAEQEKIDGIFSATAVRNMTKTMLDVSIVTDGEPNDFGVLSPGATAVMGCGNFILGKELKVVWLDDFDSDNPIPGEAFFDTMKLADIADQIAEVEFVYVGDQKWKLRAYRKVHRYDEDLIREMDSE